ncbi:MAG: iron ABC transporter permease [Treponema sp.]|nr:iron ABC transporter permease [Treponema sp.]
MAEFCGSETETKSISGASIRRNKNPLLLIISLVILFISLMLSLLLGAEALPLGVLLGGGDRFERIIFFDLRLPRSLLVLVTGLLLGGSGAVFQLFFRNPLAEPGIMGISAGATLGAVSAGVLGLGAGAAGVAGMATGLTGGTAGFAALLRLISPINLFAFLGALGAGALVTFLAFSRAGRSAGGGSIMLLICGSALGTLYSSISSMMLLTTNREFHSLYTWILGSFNGRGWKELIFILIPAIASIIIMFSISKPLDLLAGGETSAASLGVEVNRLRLLVLVSGALAVSAGVCAGGTIGFVGLIAPHVVRKLASPRARTLIPFSMIFGAILLLLADTLARIIIIPSELPTGIITSILGVPFFLSLCLTNSRRTVQ